MHESVVRHARQASLCLLRPSSYFNTYGPGEQSSNAEVNGKGELILALNLPLVLPGPSLRVSHILSESVGDPRGVPEFVFKPTWNNPSCVILTILDTKALQLEWVL